MKRTITLLSLVLLAALALAACSPAENETVEIHLAPRSLPLLMGDRRQAWERLRARWPGREMTYRLDSTFTRAQIKVLTGPLS